MQTIGEIVVPVTTLFLTLFALWLFCRIACNACNKLYGFLYKIAPEGSFRRQCTGIALWIALIGMFGWFTQDELKMSNEQLFAFLSIWSLTVVTFAVLAKILPDGTCKRVCGWIFGAVMIIPPLWLCFRLPGKGGRGNGGFWRHVSRGIQGAGAAGAAAAPKKGKKEEKKEKPPK